MFSTILADPPWRTNSARTGRLTGRRGFADSYAGAKNAKLPYPSMTNEAIAALEIPAAPDAHLWMWTINGFLEAALTTVRAWDFKYSTTLVWAKNAMGGGLGESFGITTEFLIFARRGRLPVRNRVTGTWFNWKRPYELVAPEKRKSNRATVAAKHSGKPEESYALIEHVSPGPFVELFSRAKQPRLGWSYWGNESLATARLA